jgi:hypothetical protein
MRKWRAANPDKARIANKKYREANPEHYKGLISAWSKANPEKLQGYHLKKAYGITVADKAAMLEAQGGRCGICGGDDPGTKLGWQVDADHATEPPKVRGILCKKCNTALGQFAHSPELLSKAIEWLGKSMNFIEIQPRKIARPPRHKRRRGLDQDKMNRIKGYLASHLGCHAKEASRELGIPYETMRHYLSKIRAEWRE